MPIKAFVFDVYGTLFDPQSVASHVERVMPGRGEFVSLVWRQKQLEYTWLRTAMGAFVDFDTLTRDALDYAVATAVEDPDRLPLDQLSLAFDHLSPFADAAATLSSLREYRLAVLSNGSRRAINTLLSNNGFNDHFETIVCSDDVSVYKPHPDFYRSIATRLALDPADIALVSSNGFDLAAAGHFGLKTLRIERMQASRLHELTSQPSEYALDKALRTQMDGYMGPPDYVCKSLLDITTLAPSIAVTTHSKN